MAHTGRCFCGQVRYTIDAEPIFAGMCWCRDCQYVAGGSATVAVLFPDEAASFTGDVATIEKIAESGNPVERGFCRECGTLLYSRVAEADGTRIRIRAGTLDDPELMPPQVIIWASSAPKWAVLDPRLPQFPKAPPAAALRQPESQP